MKSVISPPGLFQIELTSFCNIDCTMCARSYGLTRPVKHMEIELFKKIVDQSALYKMPIHWLHHFGETLMYPYLEEALLYFKKHGYGPGSISTNALLLDDKKIDILLQYDREVLCCIDTMDAEAYKNIRNNDHFERVKNNITHFIKKRNDSKSNVKIAIQLLRTNHNIDENIHEMMDYFGNHEAVRFIEKRTDKHPNGEDITIGKSYSPKSDTSKCIKIFSELNVLSDGRIAPCCWDADGAQIIGNVHTQTIAEIWQGIKHIELQNDLKNGNFAQLSLCEKCTDPVTDPVSHNSYGLIELINSYAKQWMAQNKKVAIAPVNNLMIELFDKSLLNQVNVVAFCDSNYTEKKIPFEIPLVTFEELAQIKPEVLFIFSPKFSSEIYFQQKHWQTHGIEIVVLGEYL